MVSGTCIDCPREDGVPVPVKCKNAARYDHRMPVLLRFTIPGPPVPKARARVVASPGKPARAVTPSRTRAYEHHVGVMALAARARYEAPGLRVGPLGVQPLRPDSPHKWPLDARYSLSLVIFRSRDAGDLSNVAKAVEDGCEGILWTNDSSVRAYHEPFRIRSCPKGQERVEVEVRVLENS